MAKTKKSEIERAIKVIKSGDGAAIDALGPELFKAAGDVIVAEHGRESDKKISEAVSRGMRLGSISENYRKEMKELADSFDYSLPEYNGELGGHRLAECRKALNLTQGELATITKIDQPIISMAENGKFFGPSRDKIWKKIFMLQCEQHITETKGRTYSGDTLKDFAQIMQPLLDSLGFGKTPLERKDEEIALLKAQVQNLKEGLELSKKIIDMNLLDRCCELEKQLAAALTANAEYAKLFALKGAAVAADELQETIEAKIRKGNP